jgi:predicted nucleotidyltransferase
MAPNPDSPRLAAVIRNGEELLSIAEEAGAIDIALCGSVARGDDEDDKDPPSDLDFYVPDFRDPESRDARQRADRLVDEFRRVLAPFGVDVRPLPGWFLSSEHEATMKRDAIDLRVIIAEFG